PLTSQLMPYGIPPISSMADAVSLPVISRPSKMHLRTLAFLMLLLVFPLSVLKPQVTSSWVRNPLNVRPIDRVASRIDEEERVTLRGHVHPMASTRYAIARAAQSQRMQRMILVLRPDPTQEAALEELLQAQQDPASPYYHQWQSAESFGERFGVSARDLEQVSN